MQWFLFHYVSVYTRYPDNGDVKSLSKICGIPVTGPLVVSGNLDSNRVTPQSLGAD